MAGINGAGINAAGINGAQVNGTSPPGGIFGATARQQYRALAAMRWRMFQNGMRSNQGVMELGARTFSMMIYGMMGLAMSIGLGFGAYAIVSGRDWTYLPLLLWAVFMMWQLLPVLLASFQDQFDLGILLRFPVSFGSYLLLYLIFGLVDVSTITGALACLGLWTGITVARPGLFAWTALALVVFAVFNILLARAIYAWIDRWLAQRRTREILGAVFLLAMLSLQLLNPALHDRRHGGAQGRAERDTSERQLKAEYMPWLRRANMVQNWLPPGLASRAVRRVGEAHPFAVAGSPALESLESLGLLGLYTLAAGAVLSARLKAEYRGENLGQAPARQRAQTRDTSRQFGGSGPIAAVIEKDLRALFRTLPLIWAIGTPLIMVVVIASVFRNGGGQGRHVFALALPICIVYAQLGFIQVFYNNLGTEGPGVQLYFLSPTPIRTVMLAKNLLHSVLFAMAAILAGVLSGLRLGVPDGVVIAGTVGWLVFSLPCNLAAGNIFSLTMPYRVNPGRITRQRGSQANALLGLLIQVGIIAVGAAVFAIAWALDRLWITVPVFVVLAAIAFQVWRRVLDNCDSMANKRRDELIEKLAKTG
jgi:ABC-2 type transport system permease protein